MFTRKILNDTIQNFILELKSKGYDPAHIPLFRNNQTDPLIGEIEKQGILINI